MTIGIVGLGLIGGSLAKAYKRAGYEILGADRDRIVLDFALLDQSVNEELTDENLAKCETVFLALPPEAAVKWMEEKAEILNEGQIVIDCCGTKKKICERGFELAEKNHFVFAGGHPMAGLQFGGYKHSKANLFDGALFVLVINDRNNLNLLKKIKGIISDGGFEEITYTTAEDHDRMIAFTSQMPHIVSNAFVKSSTPARYGTAVSAGSYRDFTRVAYLDADMWTELFMENRDNLKNEIDVLVSELQKYSDALSENSPEKLKALLEEGKERKVEVDTRWD